MSAVDAPKPVDLPQVGTAELAPAPVLVSDNLTAPVEAPKSEEMLQTEGEAVAPVEEKEEKIVEPIHSGALGYKAPGLKKCVNRLIQLKLLLTVSQRLPLRQEVLLVRRRARPL
jgi:hypothetical protein